MDWLDYYWRAVRACFATLAEEGSRKDEVAKETAATPFRKGRFTFDSLRWKIDGQEVICPTRAQLRSLRVGDGVWLRHGVSKNDAFGAYFAATPSFLAFRDDTERCACRELAELEIAAALEPARRALHGASSTRRAPSTLRWTSSRARATARSVGAVTSTPRRAPTQGRSRRSATLRPGASRVSGTCATRSWRGA